MTQASSRHHCYLCYRGADKEFLCQILAYFYDMENYEILPPESSEQPISLPELRQKTWTSLEAGHDLLVILDKNFTWQTYQRTLGYLVERARRELATHFKTILIRAEHCEGSPHDIDLADAHTPDERFNVLMEWHRTSLDASFRRRIGPGSIKALHDREKVFAAKMADEERRYELFVTRWRQQRPRGPTSGHQSAPRN